MAQIAPQDAQTIRQWASRLTAQVTLLLAPGAGNAGERLAHFSDEFKALAPDVQVRKAPDEPFRAPAIIIGRHQNIAYQAIPLNKELQPFLDALHTAADPNDPYSKPGDPSSRIELPAELSLFIAMQCPHCPHAVGQLLPMADANPQMRAAIIDGVLFDEQAKAHAIRSVPTLILDNHLRWSGQIDMAEVLRQCIQRDPAQLSAASLRQIIETGEAARLAAMMTASDQIFPALFDLLTHERWSVRLGAMVVAEYLADDAPELADRLIDPLWGRFANLPEPVQGDVVQVIGQLGNEAAKSCLENIASGDYAESVKEAAVEELENRSNP